MRAGAEALELASTVKLAGTATSNCGSSANEMGGQVDVNGVAEQLVVFGRSKARGPSVPRVETHGNGPQDGREFDGNAVVQQLGRSWGAVAAGPVCVAAVNTDELVEKLRGGRMSSPATALIESQILHETSNCPKGRNGRCGQVLLKAGRGGEVGPERGPTVGGGTVVDSIADDGRPKGLGDFREVRGCGRDILNDVGEWAELHQMM